MAVGVLSVALCACGTAESASTATTHAAVSVSGGWKTYVYEQAALSVPANWKVVTDYVCPEAKGPGTLFLGPSKQPGDVCPEYSLERGLSDLDHAPRGNVRSRAEPLSVKHGQRPLGQRRAVFEQ